MSGNIIFDYTQTLYYWKENHGFLIFAYESKYRAITCRFFILIWLPWSRESFWLVIEIWNCIQNLFYLKNFINSKFFNLSAYKSYFKIVTYSFSAYNTFNELSEHVWEIIILNHTKNFNYWKTLKFYPVCLQNNVQINNMWFL